MLAHLPCWSWLKGYKSNMWRNDVKAGLTVGIMLVPQGMAYATIAGLPVVHGLYAALVPAIVYGIWGTSRHLSVGPVAMDSLLVAAGLAGLAAEGSDPYIALAILQSKSLRILILVIGISTPRLPVLRGISIWPGRAPRHQFPAAGPRVSTPRIPTAIVRARFSMFGCG